MQKKANVVLLPREKSILSDLLADQTICPAKRRRILALSLLSTGVSDEECAQGSSMSLSSIKKMRTRYKTIGFEGTINGKPKGHRPRALTAEVEAKLYALTIEMTENGRKTWTLKSLRTHLIEAEGIFLTLESIRRIIKRQAGSHAESMAA
jgi:transposase